MKHILSISVVLVCLSVCAIAQSEGTVGIGPVTPVFTTTGFPHFQSMTWTPDNNDPFALTGTIDVLGGTPGGGGIIIASLGGADELGFGFVPVLVSLDPANVSNFGYFGYGFAGELFIPNVSRQIPALFGMQMHVQTFEFSPILTSSNSLVFDIAL